MKPIYKNSGSSTSKRGKKYNVCKTLPHERFEWTLRYDIGLLKVSKKIKFGPNVQRARLITHNMWERPTSKLTVAGFGTTTVCIDNTSIRILDT